MKGLSILRFVQIVFCFPIIILFATAKMRSIEQIIFIALFTLYTVVYELIFLTLSKRKRTTKRSSS